jgi:hypothetical protein
MDLTTTQKIKRRVLNIEPNQNQEITDCTIKISNWTKNQNLINKKVRVSSFFLNNGSLPCFVPKWISTPYTSNDFINKPTYLVDKGSGPVVPSSFFYSPVPNNETIDYIVSIRNITTGQASSGNVYSTYVLMKDSVSKFVSNKPASKPVSAYQQYTNPYYFFFDTTDFCEIVEDAINSLFQNIGFTLFGASVRVIRTSNGYALYYNSTTGGSNPWANFELQFSQSLIDLFQFKHKDSINSTKLKTIDLNSATILYENQTWFPVFSSYVPNYWFPYDLLVIKSDLSVETEVFYNNNGFLPSNYEDIILTFKLVVEQPELIYNIFNSELDPDSGWLSYQNNNSGENITFSVMLRIRETNDLVPYTIKKGEKAFFVIEELTTD